MTNDPKAGKGIDPEMLAAYIEKRLSPEQRADVEAQLANDPDSHAVLVESMRALDAMEETGVPRAPEVQKMPVVLVPKTRTRWWVYTGGALAAAAAIVLVVWTSLLPGGEGANAGLERVVALANQERHFESRIAAQINYRPLLPTFRGSQRTSDERIRSVVAQAREALRNSPSAQAERALGLILMFSHDFDEAVHHLSRSAELRPDDARIQSDLAAAYLERAVQSGDRLGVGLAIAAAQRAIDLDQNLAPAHYNLALSLERNGQAEAARQAWHAYLSVETDSRWAEDARSHLERLQHSQ